MGRKETAEQFNNRSLSRLSRAKATQSLNTFPNEPTKQIDYVLVYDKLTEYQLRTDKKKFRKHKIRELFFDKLEREKFEVYEINFTNDKDEEMVYALLHCSNERLLEEADELNFEMKLRNCRLDDLESISADKSLKSKLNKSLNKKFQEEVKSGNIPSAVYDPFISYMYEGVSNKEIYPMGPFSNNTRMLLVDNILNNITFMNDQEILKYRTEEKIKSLIMDNKSNTDASEIKPIIPQANDIDPSEKERSKNANKGLLYMIQDGYFLDAFVLHDESKKDVDFINELISYINEKNSENEDSTQLDEVIVETDVRQNLKDKWASVKRILFFQPLWELREYFGELNAFYFAWFGTFISTLWIPAAIGIAFSCYGLKVGIDNAKNLNSSNLNTNVEYYTNIFLYSFDNDLMPYFSIALVIWGMFFTEYWSRKQTKLAFGWDTDNFNDAETDLPDYYRKAQKRKNAWSCTKKLYQYEKPVKKFLSFFVLLLMVGAVCMSIAAVVIYRVWIKTKVFPTDSWGQLFVGNFGSIFLNTMFIGLLNQIYKRLARITTKWENHRTLSEFNNNLVLKLFIFNFANNYGTLIYLAYFRQIDYPNGYFNMGSEYVDKCQNNYCTPLLTTQLLVSIISTPLANLGFHAVLPWMNYRKNMKKIKENVANIYEPSTSDNVVKDGEKFTHDNLNEKTVQYYLNIEREKKDSEDFIREEYLEKTSLYGYMIIFGCVFSLAPFLILIIFLFNLRIISKGYLMYHRRPIGYKAQNTGIWTSIHRFLNIAGIANLSFYTALKSTWSLSSTSFIANSNANRYTYIVIFENGAFLAWLLILFLIPSVPTKIKIKRRLESDYIKKILQVAKQVETKVDHTDRYKITQDDETKNLLDSEDSEYDSDEENTKPRSSKVHPRSEV